MVAANLAQGHRASRVAGGLFHAARGRRFLAGRLGGQLLAASSPKFEAGQYFSTFQKRRKITAPYGRTLTRCLSKRSNRSTHNHFK